MPNNLLVYPLGGPAGPPGPPGPDIYAATRVVSLIPGDGTDLTLAAAVAALPADGGTIFIKQGVYPQAAPIALPNKPIRFVGAGSGWDGPGATTLDLGANLIALFTNANKKQYRFEHMNVIGNGAVGQIFFQNDQGSENYCDFEDVIVKDIQTCFAHTQPFWVRLLQFEHRPGLANPAQFWTFLGGVGGTSFIWADQTKVVGAMIDDNPFLYATNSEFTLTNSGVPTPNFIRSIRASACQFAGEIQIQGGASKITGCTFTNGIFGVPPARYLDFLAGESSVAGNVFEIPGTSEEIRVAGNYISFYANEGFDFVPKVTETGTADFNRFEDIALSSTILGASTIVSQWNTQTVSVDTLLDEVHRTTLVDASGANRTITLPTAASAKYRKYTVKKIDASANTVTIDAAGAETIDGSLTVVIGIQYGSITIQSDGTSWSIIVSNASGPFGIFAASRIVSLVPGEGTDLTIAAAIAALPAAGGDIYVKGGTYPIAAPLDFGAKVVRLRGAGSSANFSTGPTTLVPAAGISLFKNGGEGSSVEDITAEGDNATSQVFYEGTSSIRFYRVDVHDIAGIIRGTGGAPEVEFTDSFINVPSGPGIPLADRFVWKADAANGELVFNYVELFVTGSGATLMSGVTAGANGPTFRVVDSYVGGGGGGGSTNFWFAQRVVWTQFEIDNAQFEVSGAFNTIVNCGFLDFAIKFKAVWNFISNSKFSQGGIGGGFLDSQLHFSGGFAGVPIESVVTGCLFYGNFVSNFGIKVENVSPVSIANCIFENHVVAGVTLTAGTVPNASMASVTGCNFTEGTPLTEGDANVVGRYTGNIGFSGSTILGPDSVTEGVRRKQVTGGATVNALTPVFTHQNDKGLAGAGSIKNTGANDLTIRRTVTDGYGITDFQDDNVPAGAVFTWPMDAAIGTALPSYVSFMVSVRSTTPGSPTTYDLRHSSVGAY